MNVLLTGAAGGLGHAMAVECGKRGYDLFLTDMDEAALRRVQAGLERHFGVTVAVKVCDLTKPESVDELLAAFDGNGLRFDMLLNIAGLDYEGAFLSREREAVCKIVSLNDAGTLRITHAVLERRRKGKPFTAVFVSSLASLFPTDALRARRRAPAHVGGRDRQLAVEERAEKMAEGVRRRGNPSDGSAATSPVRGEARLYSANRLAPR